VEQAKTVSAGASLRTPPVYVNLPDSIPRGFEAEVFIGQMPFLLPIPQHESTEGSL